MGLKHNHLAVILRNGLLKKWRQMMSKKCRAFSASKLGKPDSKATLREAFYAGWEAALAEHQEPVEATPYTLKRIAWELERTAVGDGFYGNALRVAKDMPGITPEDRSVLDRYATGTQTGTDHVHLQRLARRLYNKDDRELLELAAKAAGVILKPIQINNVTKQGDDRFIGYIVDCEQWARVWFNPLTNDADALRLAVKCNLNVCMGYGSVSACLQDDGSFHRTEEIKDDPYAATRRAIVRAAAEIGRNMK